MSHNTVIFVANDFGFGPISRTHTVARALKNARPELTVNVFTSGINNYLFTDDDIGMKIVANLRDKEAIKNQFDSYSPETTLVVSTMNRFALSAAREQGFRTVVLDGLFWFWKKRPQEYSFADYEFRFILPWQLEKYKNKENIFYFAGPVEIEPNRARAPQNKNVLVTLNGYMTPFYKPEHDIYLEWMTHVINALQSSQNLIVTGNKIIRNKIMPTLHTGIRFNSMGKDEYLSTLQYSRAVLLNGGSNSFLEALVIGMPFLFSLPSNQSQYELIHKLSIQTKQSMEFWCPALSLIPHHARFRRFTSESEAIDYWSGELRSYLAQIEKKSIAKAIAEQIVANLEIVQTDPNFKKLMKISDRSRTASGEVCDKLLEIIEAFDALPLA